MVVKDLTKASTFLLRNLLLLLPVLMVLLAVLEREVLVAKLFGLGSMIKTHSFIMPILISS
jgi:hypothetical protein